ncbi:MAG: TetR/AcrR family transcriptional regulator [Planctomycetota bacterium]|nr:TetR/AcrR family transcriptional regulator [Planctomycetota bacterium]
MPTAVELFGRGAEPRDTRERILHVALDLFYGNGFHAVGLDRILAEVGVTKTTFYNHFPSREDLVLECVKVRDVWEREAFERAVRARAGYDPRALLLAIFDVMDDWFNDPRYRGCLFIAASAEFPSRQDPVHKAAAQHFASMEEQIRLMAEAAGVEDPAALATSWVLLLEGAVTYRLVTGDDSVAKSAKVVAEQLLAAQLPA